MARTPGLKDHVNGDSGKWTRSFARVRRWTSGNRPGRQRRTLLRGAWRSFVLDATGLARSRVAIVGCESSTIVPCASAFGTRWWRAGYLHIRTKLALSSESGIFSAILAVADGASDVKFRQTFARDNPGCTRPRRRRRC